jgi:hypothetical protein
MRQWGGSASFRSMRSKRPVTRGRPTTKGPPTKVPKQPSSAVLAAAAALKESPLYAGYLAEMIVLLTRVGEDIDVAKSLLRPIPPGAHIISQNHEFHERMQAALLAAGSFMHFVTPVDLTKRRKPLDFFRHERAVMLRDELQTVSLTELAAVDVRHRLEHVDEYLDRIAMRLPTGVAGRKTSFARNLIVNSRSDLERTNGQLQPVVALRVYAVTEDRYHHLDASVHVETLRAQAAAARAVLAIAFDRAISAGDPVHDKLYGRIDTIHLLDEPVK